MGRRTIVRHFRTVFAGLMLACALADACAGTNGSEPGNDGTVTDAADLVAPDLAVGPDGSAGLDGATDGSATTPDVTPTDAQSDGGAADDTAGAPDACRPDCGGLACGPDGCGGFCGTCTGSQDACVLGRCECQPRCEPGSCGIDGCGGYCEPCVEGRSYLYDESGEPLEVITEVYCDEQQRACVPPQVNCADGWCRIPAGSFRLGNDGSYDRGRTIAVGPVHPVVLTRSFLIQQTEVTIAQYKDVLATEADPGRFTACGQDCPVVTVTPFDAMRFANRLSEREGRSVCYALEGCSEPAPDYGLECARARFTGPDCAGYRLPSEAEWEFAAAAGSRFCAPNGSSLFLSPGYLVDTIDAVAWYIDNSTVTYEGCADLTDGGHYPDRPTCAGPHPVAGKRPNRFGLYDTSGNITEFTGTLKGEYAPDLAIDPGFDAVIDRSIVARGGFFGNDARHVCSSSREGLVLTERGARVGHTGFRLVRTLLAEP